MRHGAGQQAIHVLLQPPRVFSLTDLPRETDGTVKRQIYVDGFFPKMEILTESTSEAVVMTRSGTCHSYNTTYDQGER